MKPRAHLEVVRALMAGVASVLAANALLGTVVGLRVARTDSLSTSSFVVSAFSLGIVLGAWRAVSVIRRVGHIRAFTAFAGLATVAAALFMLVRSPILWGLLRVGIGFCAAGIYVAVESWINEGTPPPKRGRVLAVYITTCQLAMVAGQLMVSIYDIDGFEPLLIGAALYALALVPVALTYQPQPEPPVILRLGLGELVRCAPVGFVGCLVAGCTAGALLQLGPVYAAGAGFTADATSIFMAAVVGGGLLFQWPVGRLSERMDRRLLIELLAVGCLAVSIACFLSPPTWQIGLGAIVGAFAFVLYPASLAHAHDMVGPGRAVAASGTLLMSYAFGTTIAPAAGGLVLEAFGARAYFPYIAVLCVGLAAFALKRLLRRRRLNLETLAPFVPVGNPLPILNLRRRRPSPSSDIGSSVG